MSTQPSIRPECVNRVDIIRLNNLDNNTDKKTFAAKLPAIATGSTHRSTCSHVLSDANVECYRCSRSCTCSEQRLIGSWLPAGCQVVVIVTSAGISETAHVCIQATCVHWQSSDGRTHHRMWFVKKTTGLQCATSAHFGLQTANN